MHTRHTSHSPILSPSQRDVREPRVADAPAPRKRVMAGLFRVMPKRAGLDFIMRGESISAKEALNWGLINKVVSEEKLDKEVSNLAKQLASLAPNTMKMG